jgi:hypothetical protein
VYVSLFSRTIGLPKSCILEWGVGMSCRFRHGSGSGGQGGADISNAPAPATTADNSLATMNITNYGWSTNTFARDTSKPSGGRPLGLGAPPRRAPAAVTR